MAFLSTVAPSTEAQVNEEMIRPKTLASTNGQVKVEKLALGTGDYAASGIITTTTYFRSAAVTILNAVNFKIRKIIIVGPTVTSYLK